MAGTAECVGSGASPGASSVRIRFTLVTVLSLSICTTGVGGGGAGEPYGRQVLPYKDMLQSQCFTTNLEQDRPEKQCTAKCFSF